MRPNTHHHACGIGTSGAGRERAYKREPRRASAGPLLLCAASLLALAGCSQTGRVSNEHTGSIRPVSAPAATAAAPDPETLTTAQLAAALEGYGQRYERSPRDREIGLQYASALQIAGRNDQSLAVMQQVAIQHSQDRSVLAAYGKALAAAGELPRALETVRRAQTPDHPDWRLLSAEGAILDQLGQRDQARVLFDKALVIAPEEPSVLSNLGMSALMANDLKGAERYLSRAAARPGADPRVRQNLALAVGLQGRFDEAERIASAVLSPREAEANIGYLRQMLSQRSTWSELRSEAD